MNLRNDRPPHLPGFDHIAQIGAGGYAAVHLYQQHRPNRQVAIKVLSADITDASFESEANVMAQVSEHPYIVSIFEAGVAGDGRPYLVMEYYPQPNFLERARTEHFAVADALRVGIQVSGALETAHRVGVLHHDVKPANILTSAYGRPGLTDFGIASAGATGETHAVSIPWSPPEAFGPAQLDARADIYSLAATVYHLLAGRSPFAIAGGANGELDLMVRIEREPVPAVGRADVPPSLERALARALAKHPDQRPDTMVEFARSLQTVEGELQLAMTALELPNVATPKRRTDADDGDATRVRAVTQVDAQPSSGRTPPRATGAADADELSAHTKLRERHDAPPGTAAPRRATTRTARSDDGPHGRSRLPWYVSAGVVGVIALVLAAIALAGGSRSGDASPATTVFSVTDINDTLLSAVADLTADVSDGTEPSTARIVTFTWAAPDGVDDRSEVAYLYTLTIDGTSETSTTELSEVVTTADAGVEVCIRVVATRSGFSDSPSREACTTA